MPGSRVRRPPTWRVLFLFVLALAAAAACRMPSSAPAAGSGTSEAAEKTKRMEEKSAEIEKHAEAVRTMEGTDQEKIDAMNSLDQERRELNDMDQGK
jgi:TolA-binding protein